MLDNKNLFALLLIQKSVANLSTYLIEIDCSIFFSIPVKTEKMKNFVFPFNSLPLQEVNDKT